MIGRLGSMLPFEDVAVGARFLAKLPFFLRHQSSLDEAHATLRRRLEQREADFLDLARRGIYSQAGSPCRRLLELAGCEYGDLEHLVAREGLDRALHILYRQGVYLTVDEFKGRRPVVRGSATLMVDPDQFHNSSASADLLRYRSGSRGAKTPVPVDLASVRDRTVNIGLSLGARGGIGWEHAYWEVPGSMAMVHILEHHGFDSPARRWFSQVDPAAPGLHPRYSWSARLMRRVGALAGARLPRPEYVPLDDPLPIAHWMAKVVRAGRTPHLTTYASVAVRLCQAAEAAGLDLRSVQFTVTGEPVTPARLAAIGRTGAVAVPRCGTSEAGLIGYGCLAPAASDDLHFYHDLNAMIQPGPTGPQAGLSPSSLLVTSLRPTARLILLNVSLGDQAQMARRGCGCPMQKIGWTTHLHTLRSYEKLTAGGMSFLDADVIRVLEEVLPARFGGGPIDYQLLEEVRDGEPRLRLLVHPRLGALDEEAVADSFLAAIGGGSGVERVMELQWREASLVRVERQAPRATTVGKVLHVHSESGPSFPAAHQSVN
jgi:hypothetical protein